MSNVKTYLYKRQLLVSLLGIITGATLFLLLPWQQKWIFIVASIALVTYAVIILYGIRELFKKQNLVKVTNTTYIHLFIIIILFSIFFTSSYFWARIGQLGMLSTTSVINTDMVLNSFMPILGFILISFISFALSSELKLPRVTHNILIIVISLLAILPLSGEWMLVMIKLNTDLLDIFNLSYIAKVNYYIWLYPYLLLCCFIGILIYYWKIQVFPAIQNTQSKNDHIEHRLALAQQKMKQSYLKRFILLVVTLFSILLWWDLVASNPIERSPAIEVKLGVDNAIHLNIEKNKLDDSDLHRFSWVASDGKEVRFFVIRHYADQSKYGVVFDSCMLCGDAGYAKEGNNVICLACGVRIFIPSIGRKGGCNPIPIDKWTQKDNEIIIPQTSLEMGLRFFGTVLSIDVVDPVNGKHLINTEAPYQYQYGNKAYFFTEKESYDLFRNDPLKYIKE
ncbi:MULTISPECIES: Fe-S-containing protein [Pasteurellaceae]|uniref:Fe-S-containing protein n=1 Tax=Pasteurellaceae TaxID=712 RepID=UPI0027627113|nr:Fe-S-containing protein [Pasteurella atlantica]MDP8038585.1 Fe-S-containing protein [Pasteurella atlantica]MDP8040677.1 Fe-S-containing protein [Pasteurella atlantica]MDP8042812.1 Fe-S-containing protein [Pasteurella atlantica]MDP8141547.1 Fe-S-containing protein [Pasteurella atlantica]MDP8159536.1 Fe-S-containing protein [Pasteurella atlantica]